MMVLKCARTACESGDAATWFNSSTREFYCLRCALKINRANQTMLCKERPRDARQAAVYAWVKETFGSATLNTKERALRFIEEAIELAQAEGLSKEQTRSVLDHVYAKPPGSIESEVGGVGVTLLGYCEAKGLSAEHEEVKEADRVSNIDPAYFRERHDKKAKAGIAAFSNAGDK